MSSVLDKLKRKLMVKPEVEPYKPINIKLFNARREITGERSMDATLFSVGEKKENERSIDFINEKEKKEGKVGKKNEGIKINDKTYLNLNRDELMDEFNKIRKELNENKKIGITLDIQKEKEILQSMKKDVNNNERSIKKKKSTKIPITKYKKKIIIEEEEEEEGKEELKKSHEAQDFLGEDNKKVKIPIVFENLNEKITKYEGEKEEPMEEPMEEIIVKKTKKEKITKKTKKNDNERKIEMFGVENIIQIGDTPIKDRIIKNPLPNIKLSLIF